MQGEEITTSAGIYIFIVLLTSFHGLSIHCTPSHYNEIISGRNNPINTIVPTFFISNLVPWPVNEAATGVMEEGALSEVFVALLLEVPDRVKPSQSLYARACAPNTEYSENVS